MLRIAPRFNLASTLAADDKFPPVSHGPFAFTLHSAVQAKIDPTSGKKGFVTMAALANVCRAAVFGVVVGGVGANAAEVEHGAVKSVCLNPAETREEVKARRLIEPFAALKYAAAQRKAEALSARLCHIGDDFIYEITLLHRDGRLVHVEMEATTGKMVSRPPREPPVKN